MGKQNSAPPPEDFSVVERDFTEHIRNHDLPLPSGVADERMDVYRGLFFRNIKSFLGGSFPVLSKVLGDDRWTEIMQDYFSRHQATTPLFPRMPREFLLYLEKLYEPHAEDPPFMMQLAHYEWVDQEVRIDIREINDDGIDANGNLLSGIPALNPLCRLLSYDWPVHRISKKYIPKEPSQVYLVVSRTRDDQNVFVELNPVSARLMDLLRLNESGGASKLSGEQALLQIACELEAPDQQAIVRAGNDILQKMLAKEIILGTVSAGQ